MNLLRDRDALKDVERLPFHAANFEELTVLHAPQYVSQVYHISESGRGALNPDTYLNRSSFRRRPWP